MAKTIPLEPRSLSQTLLAFLGFAAFTFGLSWLTSFWSQPGNDPWYQDLAKSPFTPPNIAFPIVWSTLYLLLSLAATLVYREGVPLKHKPLMLYILHIIFLSAWTPLFFSAHLITISAAWIAIMVLWAAGLIAQFTQHNQLAGALLIPYLIWLSFAFYLNASIMLLN